MENLSAYTVLHLLARNPQAASLPVQWAFNDVETGGYARREDFVRTLDPRARFLIVTEGSSDAAILRNALKLLRPHLAVRLCRYGGRLPLLRHGQCLPVRTGAHKHRRPEQNTYSVRQRRRRSSQLQAMPGA
jgi:hypothetical protein